MCAQEEVRDRRSVKAGILLKLADLERVGSLDREGLRVFLPEPLDELLDDALVHLDLAEHEQDLAGQLLRLGLGGAQALGDDAVAYVAHLKEERGVALSRKN